uniref:WD_REPEATS_REGION domain-containing protein n=1 Tax=Ascaris lumbricoides TaxID=6252 RepID=A0A0M3IK12_ASCLU
MREEEGQRRRLCRDGGTNNLGIVLCDWLVASDSRCRLCVFSVHEVLSRRSASSGQLRAPCIAVELSDPIWALCHLGEVLLCGDAQGALFAYSCSQLTSASSSLTQPKPMFCVNAFGIQPLRTNPNEVNTIEALSKTQFVYGGAFDYAVRLVDAERPDKVVSKFDGHKGSINELVARSENEFLSASDDGTVRVWDTRSDHMARIIRVCDQPELRRSGCGVGVCALDLHGSLMVCGGDIDLGLWLLDSGSLVRRIDCERPPNMRHLVAKMNGERILCGGTSSFLFQYSYAGEHITSVRTSASAIYSIEQNIAHGKQMTTVGGQSHLIDVFLNTGYVAFSLSTSAFFLRYDVGNLGSGL